MSISYKICTKCGESKPLESYPKNARYKSGIDARCKQCRNSANKKYRDDKPGAHAEWRRQNYEKNRDHLLAKKREVAEKRKPLKKAYDQQYRQIRAEKIAAYKRAWESLKSDDPLFKIKRNLRRRVAHVLAGNRKSDTTFALIGCTAEEFKYHIEKQFLPGMSWDNYGVDGWHIDHIKPCYLFDLSDPAQQRECFHFTNQRPLWAIDNLSRPRSDQPRKLSASRPSFQ